MKFTAIGSADEVLPRVHISSITSKSEPDKGEEGIIFDKPPSYNWDNEELSRTPKWVKSNLCLGNYGEAIAKNFLNDQGVNVIKKSDRKGYDLENKKNGSITGYEIKTASKFLSFFMSTNELAVAARMMKNYILFFILVHKEKQIIDGYFIVDPVSSLNLSLEQMLKRQDYNVTVTSASFKIEFTEETLKKFPHHDLTLWKNISQI